MLRQLATLALFATAPVLAQPPVPAALPAGTLLQVDALGEVSRKPDIARITAGVVTQAPEAKAAMDANAARMGAVIDALQEAGIEGRDVRTTGLNLQPQYDYREGQGPRLTGYQAGNTVSVTVRRIERVGPVLDALVAAGANQIGGPEFTLEDPEPALDEARSLAIATAQRRAGLYAGAVGLQVRRIVSITESDGSFEPPTPVFMKAQAMEARSTPVEPGENRYSARLQVWFELGR